MNFEIVTRQTTAEKTLLLNSSTLSRGTNHIIWDFQVTTRNFWS